MDENEIYKRVVTMGWAILAYKMAYYNAELVGKKYKKELTIPDADYDKLENAYRSLCAMIGMQPTAADMVGFDKNRPSCQLVRRRYE